VLELVERGWLKVLDSSGKDVLKLFDELLEGVLLLPREFLIQLNLIQENQELVGVLES
jgi:hypothetical protein